MNELPQEDTMGVFGSDGQKHHLFRTRAEEDAAVAASPLKVTLDLLELGRQINQPENEMNEIYQHVKGGVYQVIGRGTIEAPEGHNYRDMDRVLAIKEDGSWVIKPWTRVPDSEITTIPTGSENLANLQVSTDYEITNGAAVIVYRAADARVWVRLETEFMDGRFTKVGAA